MNGARVEGLEETDPVGERCLHSAGRRPCAETIALVTDVLDREKLEADRAASYEEHIQLAKRSISNRLLDIALDADSGYRPAQQNLARATRPREGRRGPPTMD